MPGLGKELAEVRKALRVDPDQGEFRVIFGATAANPNEIAILSRSVIRLLSELSTVVEVTADHLARGVAPPIGEVEGDAGPDVQVQSSDKKPCDPFIAMCYESRWFWIDNSDLQAKRTLGYNLALADTGTKEGLPVLAI
jgi:hypothetical protein